MLPKMSPAVHELEEQTELDSRTGGVSSRPRRACRPGGIYALAWAEAVYRRALRVFNRRTVGTRRSSEVARIDPYSTKPVDLTEDETRRLADIIARHPGTR